MKHQIPFYAIAELALGAMFIIAVGLWKYEQWRRK